MVLTRQETVHAEGEVVQFEMGPPAGDTTGTELQPEPVRGREGINLPHPH